MTDTEQIIDPDELSALLNVVAASNDAPAAPSAQIVASDEEVRAYDFSAPGRIIHTYMPQLELINERFSRTFRPSLFGLLRRYAELSKGIIEVHAFADYMQGLKSPMAINMVRIRPLRGTALVVFEPELIHAIVDSFFGGNGRPCTLKRQDFTPSEVRITQMLLDHALDALKQAWSYIQSLEFEFLYSETNPQFASVMAAGDSDVMVITRFTVEVGDIKGEIHVSLPYSMLEPLRTRLTAAIQNSDQEPDHLFKNELQNGMNGVEVDVHSELAQITLSLEDLTKLHVGDVIPISMPESITLDVGNVPLYRGKQGTYHGQKAIQIEERLHNGNIGEIL